MKTAHPPHLVPHPYLLLATLMLNSVTVTLDSTIANVALPHMQGGLAATQDQIGGVLTSYIVATAICLPLTGILAARIGRIAHDTQANHSQIGENITRFRGADWLPPMWQ